MGMSASQARYLSLIAQQSNLEYQGQQINQERSILSQQVSELYNTLLAMSVPTPPSTQDFTKIVYRGTIGATNYSFDASSVKPGNDGLFTVTLGYTEYGSSLQKNQGYVLTNDGTEKIHGTTLSNTGIVETPNPGCWNFSAEAYEGGSYVLNLETPDPPVDLTNIFILGDSDGDGENELMPATTTNIEGYTGSYYELHEEGTPGFDPDAYDPATCTPVVEDTTESIGPATISQEDFSNLYIVDLDGVLREATPSDVVEDTEGNLTLKPSLTYFLSGEGDESYNLAPEPGNEESYTIAGKTALTLEQAHDSGKINDTDYNGYMNAIVNANISGSNGEPYTADDFYIYIDDDSKAHFALKSDVSNGDGTAITYDFIPNGEFTKPKTFDDCKLTFDPSSGRINSIEIPNYAQDGTTIVSYTQVGLEAVTETDNLAYEDAMAQYEYAQYIYDNEQAQINAKTEKIQQQDRNLELRLQRLDTQRTQITTELDAVKKVLGDNIEKSYKTFNG